LIFGLRDETVAWSAQEGMTMAGWDGRGLVTTGWLADHLEDPGVRIFDSTVHLRPAQPGPYRVESGRADYESGHIPGAAFVDLARDLSDPSAPLGFTRLKGGALAATLGAAGIDPGLKIVCYSTSTPMWATRLWWVLRAAGFTDVAVLDGGYARWTAEGRPVETGSRAYPPAEVRIDERPGAWADRQDVLAAIGDGAVCTVNALPAGVHSGEAEVNYGRKGHIKGSRNVPYAALLDADGLYRSDADLRVLFEGVGALQRPRVIVYCGGGISATMDALALTRLGHPSVSVYDGSMSEWTRDPDLPMETGA
jgi:thiosulfate/3-mercaptopyruvate sulfurtransferase